MWSTVVASKIQMQTNFREWYAYASIAVNANNDVLLGFSNFSRNHCARRAYAVRLGSDAAGTMRDR
jgi:hypothetical protein